MKETEAKNFSSREYLERAKESILRVGDSDQVERIPLDKITPNPFQPRKTFKKAALEELAASIKERGVLQAIIVRRTTDPNTEFMFEICIGERRVLASRMAGLQYVPARIKELSDADMRAVALIENLQREDMNFIDTMNGYVGAKEDYGDAEGVAAIVRKDKRTIERYFKIHSEIHSLPEIAALFEQQAANIDYTTAEAFSKVAADIRRLQKSNKREFNRVFNRLSKDIKGSIPWLTRKFGRGAKNETGISGDGMFIDTEKELILNIRISKSAGVTTEKEKHVRESINVFLEKFTVLNSREER